LHPKQEISMTYRQLRLKTKDLWWCNLDAKWTPNGRFQGLWTPDGLQRVSSRASFPSLRGSGTAGCYAFRVTVSVDQINAWRQAPTETKVLEFKEAKNQFDTERLFEYSVAIGNRVAATCCLEFITILHGQ
jgi:hypothetical protein